ncbi:MAG: acetylornithine deacetylase [Thermoanaerobacteraceae bacterium]|nr:acetylornithine deacetylase [Thermoanaerobacteraceae bacterium]
MDIEARVCKEIDQHKEEAIKFLQTLLGFKSINYQNTGDEKEAQYWLKAQAESLGMQTELFDINPDKLRGMPYFVEPGERQYAGRPNLVAVWKGKGDGKSLLLNGHIDVVPPGDEDQWQSNPWEGEIRNGRIYGRGACDMKSGLAAMFMAIKSLHSCGFQPKGDVIFNSVVDEESTGNGTLMTLAQGYRADGAIVGEPTELKIDAAHRGVQFLRVKTFGQSGHASRKKEYVSAIEQMIKVCNLLIEIDQERQKVSHPLLPSPTISIGQINGGVAPHVVADSCEINCDVKYLPGEDPKKVREIIEKKIFKLVDADPQLKVFKPEIKWWLDADPADSGSEHVLCRLIKEAHEKVTAEKGEISGFVACCDMRHLVNRGGIPTFIYGPGSLNDAHKVNEFVGIDEYLTAVKVYALTIIRFCG